MLVAWSTGVRGKLPQLSLTPEVCMAHPLGIREQVPLPGPITSEGTEEGIVTEHYLLVLSNPWEHIHSAAATAKHSEQYLHA